MCKIVQGYMFVFFGLLPSFHYTAVLKMASDPSQADFLRTSVLSVNLQQT